MLSTKRYIRYLQSTQYRIERINSFLHDVCRTRTYVVDRILDAFGPTIIDPTIDALIVSRETQRGGDAVQRERLARQLPPLKIYIIDVVAVGRQSLPEEEGEDQKLSSTQIRARLEEQKATPPK
jgi:pantetheine-phosphate adenylyltransferase